MLYFDKIQNVNLLITGHMLTRIAQITRYVHDLRYILRFVKVKQQTHSIYYSIKYVFSIKKWFSIIFSDYAVQIFHDALNSGVHNCYLRPDCTLPMMYIDDCLR